MRIGKAASPPWGKTTCSHHTLLTIPIAPLRAHDLFHCLLRSFTFPPSTPFGPSHSNTKHLYWAPKIHYELYPLKFVWQMIKSVSLEPYGKSIKLHSVKPATTFNAPLFVSPTSRQFCFTCCLILVWLYEINQLLAAGGLDGRPKAGTISSAHRLFRR